MQKLDGLPLADFWQRACVLATDGALLLVLFLIVGFLFAAANWAIENRRGFEAAHYASFQP
jgi:hypothetical protein